MGLTSALFTGLSGLDVNQTKLSVVGNNIANVNTVAFKSSRALFRPQFYVTDSGGSPPNGEFGGTNPSQRGLGASVAAIEKNFTPGAIEPTGKATDMAIDGDGFFVVKGADQEFTRDGSFTLNAEHQLVTNTGAFVQGYGVDNDFNVQTGAIQNVSIPLGTLTTARATENVTLEGNLNASGTVASGASILTSQLLTTVGGAAAPDSTTLLTDLASTSDNATALFTSGQTITLAGKKGGRDLPDASFDVTDTSTLSDLQTFFNKAMGIDTTVPDDGDATTPTAGVAVETDATDTKSVRLVLTGNLGTENELSIAPTGFSTGAGTFPMVFADGTNAAGIASDPSGESVHTSFVAYDSLGIAVNVGVTAVLDKTSDAGNTWRFFTDSADSKDGVQTRGSGTLTFDSDGKLIASTGTTISVDRSGTGAQTPLSLKLDFSRMSSLTSHDSQIAMTFQDGSSFGSLTSFAVGDDGTITGTFSNGITHTLGQVAVATFNNPQGLVDKGGNMFVPGASSGEPIISAPLKLGAGAVRAGSLELSNVDLSEEFINLIVATTGYSAASRVITTSDQLITELLNSSR